MYSGSGESPSLSLRTRTRMRALQINLVAAVGAAAAENRLAPHSEKARGSAQQIAATFGNGNRPQQTPHCADKRALTSDPAMARPTPTQALPIASSPDEAQRNPGKEGSLTSVFRPLFPRDSCPACRHPIIATNSACSMGRQSIRITRRHQGVFQRNRTRAVVPTLHCAAAPITSPPAPWPLAHGHPTYRQPVSCVPMRGS